MEDMGGADWGLCLVYSILLLPYLTSTSTMSEKGFMCGYLALRVVRFLFPFFPLTTSPLLYCCYLDGSIASGCGLLDASCIDISACNMLVDSHGNDVYDDKFKV